MMLDTYARNFVQPMFNKIAVLLKKIGLRPNHLTVSALIFGIGTGISIFFHNYWLALLLLWGSGLLDVLDGSLARLESKSSIWGGFMDIIFDRVVETGILISIAFVYPDSQLALVILLSAIVFCISVFLTVGALVEKKGIKEFYHQTGVTERTETFIFFSLILLLPGFRLFWLYLFAGLIYFTGIQRFIEAYRLFGKHSN